MDQQSQKRKPTGDGGPSSKKFKDATEAPADYSDAVRKKYQSASRTGQACDRCKERKMRCDGNAAGCLACQQKNLRCVTTDRITGRATERGQADRLEVELITLRKHLAVYIEKYGQLEDAELAASDTYQDLPAAGAYSAQHFQTLDQQNNYMASNRISDGPHCGPIKGTVVDVLDGEVDIAAFECPTMDDLEYESGPVFNHCTKSYVQTITGAQRVEKPILPPKEEALKSIETFLGTVHLYVPILHGPTILELARKMCDDPLFQPSRAEEVTMIAVLANINYQVAVRNPGVVGQEKMKESHSMFHYCLSFMCELFLETSLESMQALAMLLLHVRCLPKPGDVWHFSTHVLNRAIDLGYHRSPSKIGLRESIFVLEMRKRVFWAVLAITTETALKLGRPMPLRMEDIDVEHPVPLEDSEISENGIVSARSGRCTFRAGLHLWKMQPLLIDLYNNFISVRRPSSEYLRNLDVLNAKIIQHRQKWSDDMSMEPETGTITVATLHIDSWAAESQLILHHPRLCTPNSPEVMERNLDECHKAAARLLNNASVLFNRYRATDFTWYSTVSCVLALGVTLHIYSRRKDQMTKERVATMRQELTEWLKIMKLADKVLRTGDIYYRTFRPRIEKVITEATNALSATSALQDGYQQGAEVQRNSGLQSNMNHAQPPAFQYGQTNGYSSATYNTAPTNVIPVNESGQNPTGSDSSAPHPPLYPEPYQYAHAGHNLVADAPYHASSNLHQSHAYGSSVSYQQDTHQPPQTSAPVLNSSSYVTYNQATNQHADAFPSLGWDDPTASALWPNTIFMMHQQQQQQQQQQHQQQL